MPASAKSQYAEQLKCEAFLRRPTVYFWTFTFAENQQDKAYAEGCARALYDLIRRRGGDRYAVWEIQQRGAWHLHLLTDVWLDVTWLRGTKESPGWLVRRGWGPIMRVERLHDVGGRRRVARYLAKYLAKGCGVQRRLLEGRMSLNDAEEDGSVRATNCDSGAWAGHCDLANKKLAGCSRGARVANTLFGWNPWTSGRPGGYLYALGRSLFLELFGELPGFRDIEACIRMGWEDSKFYDFDFLYQPP